MIFIVLSQKVLVFQNIVFVVVLLAGEIVDLGLQLVEALLGFVQHQSDFVPVHRLLVAHRLGAQDGRGALPRRLIAVLF